jgi:hypothetical protein
MTCDEVSDSPRARSRERRPTRHRGPAGDTACVHSTRPPPPEIAPAAGVAEPPGAINEAGGPQPKRPRAQWAAVRETLANAAADESPAPTEWAPPSVAGMTARPTFAHVCSSIVRTSAATGRPALVPPPRRRWGDSTSSEEGETEEPETAQRRASAGATAARAHGGARRHSG